MATMPPSATVKSLPSEEDALKALALILIEAYLKEVNDEQHEKPDS